MEHRILSEPEFKDIDLTLGLRNSQRLAALNDNPRVRIIDLDLESAEDVTNAMSGQDMVFIADVDHDVDNAKTLNVLEAMKQHNVIRIISSNILGIYNEVPGEFGHWNHEMVKNGLKSARNSDRMLSESGMTYTTLRIPWLNDRNEIKYTITHQNESYLGVSGSRQSIADVVLKIVRDPSFGANESIGIADSATQGEPRPVY